MLLEMVLGKPNQYPLNSIGLTIFETNKNIHHLFYNGRFWMKIQLGSIIKK